MDINHSTNDISTSAGAPPTLGGNRVFHESNSIIKENFIIGGDLATGGTNPYQLGTSGTASNGSFAADLFEAFDNITFGTEPTWAQTVDGLTYTSNEATTHSSYAGDIEKLEGYDVSRLFSLGDYFVLSGSIKCSLSGKIYLAVRSTNYDVSYVFPVTVVAGVVTTFSEVIPIPVSGTFGTGTTHGMNVTWMRSNNDATFQTATLNAWQAGNYLSGADQLDFHATNGATISFDKIKIEPGQIATPFWTPDYGKELCRVQRQVWKVAGVGAGHTVAAGFFFSTTLFITHIDFPVPMRIPPALTAGGTQRAQGIGTSLTISSPVVNPVGVYGGRLDGTVVGATAGQGGLWRLDSSTDYLIFDARL